MHSLLVLSVFATAALAVPVERALAAVAISSCTQDGLIALTFDDGPSNYTDVLLDQLAEANMTATFFVNLNTVDHEAAVVRMDKEGHQVASHTWAHKDLATLNATATVQQMTILEAELLKIMGKHPTYMRPPYFSWSSLTLETLGELGYKVIRGDIDTLDWKYDMDKSLQLFERGLLAGGSITLMHEHQKTIEELVPEVIKVVQESGKRAVTVGECLGDASENWYSTSRS